MELDNKFIPVFDKILNRPFNRCICTRCGNYQTHSLVYCKECGAKFVYKPKTFFGALLAMKNRDYQNRPMKWYPSFVAAIHRRGLKKQFGIELDKEFTKYIEKRLSNGR
jgi:predicted amidophosphoribosyltransferase